MTNKRSRDLSNRLKPVTSREEVAGPHKGASDEVRRRPQFSADNDANDAAMRAWFDHSYGAEPFGRRLVQAREHLESMVQLVSAWMKDGITTTGTVDGSKRSVWLAETSRCRQNLRCWPETRPNHS